MAWTDVVDGYCERTDASYWSEPLNAVSNVAFLVAAVVAWRLARRAGDRPAQVLAAGAASIGVGSFLFHTEATRWALQADVLPIRVFVLVFIGLAAVRFFAAPWWAGLLAALGFVVLSAVAVRVVGHYVGHLHGSLGYAPVPVLMGAVAVALRRRAGGTARGLLLGAGVFTVSLVLRSIDLEVCAAWPVGTHFAWHLLNGVTVGLLTVVFIRAGRATAANRPDRVTTSAAAGA